MRSFLLCLIIWALLGWACSLGGCKKGGDNESLTGNWKLSLYSEGFSGRIVYVPADSVVLLSLQPTRLYQRTVDGLVVESGYYTVATIHSIFNGVNVTDEPAISFSGSPGLPPQVIELRNDTLNLSVNAYDGNSFVYVR
jgi:hypothetical protein